MSSKASSFLGFNDSFLGFSDSILGLNVREMLLNYVF